MAGRILLEDLIDELKPQQQRGPTKKRVIVGINIATRLLSRLVMRNPALAPLQGALDALLLPSGNKKLKSADTVVLKIRLIRSKLAKAKTDDEKQRLRKQLDTLLDILE